MNGKRVNGGANVSREKIVLTYTHQVTHTQTRTHTHYTQENVRTCPVRLSAAPSRTFIFKIRNDSLIASTVTSLSSNFIFNSIERLSNSLYCD